MRIQSFASLATIAAASYHRQLADAQEGDKPEFELLSRELEKAKLIDFQDELLTGGLGLDVQPQIMTMINHTSDEGGVIEFLLLTDLLAGFNMKEGGYYQTYFQIPSAT